MISFNYLDIAMATISENWRKVLHDNVLEELLIIDQKLTTIAKHQVIYPPRELIFNAFNYTEFFDIKVVILGQDPYHKINQANGLAFAVNPSEKIPHSLKNIFTELQMEFKDSIKSTTLNPSILFNWAKQGVLLLNSTLTVIESQANSLADIGWQTITDKLIYLINQKLSNVVFILWGQFAQKKIVLIDPLKHLILQSAHPSPLSAHKGFFGNNHFIKTNQYLIENDFTPIQWL